MARKRSIFYNTLMLTAVHLLLRFVGTSFQVYLSGRIGAAGIGLLQLTMSVGNLAMVAGIAGIRTTTMYLTADELGKGNPSGVPWILSGCLRYSMITGGSVSLVLAVFAPMIAGRWIADPRVIPSIRLFAGFLPVVCLCGVMTGYFTAENRISTLAAVEVAEQLFSMGITFLLLSFWAHSDPVRACESVILGSGAGSCLTLICLMVLRLKQPCIPGPALPVAKRLTAAAIPLALADIVKSGISTLENLMVPKRLRICRKIADPLAAFGIMSGMVFPVIMFPACILFGLADLLIPELARCAACQNNKRISYLIEKTLKISMIYGLSFGGAVFLLAPELSEKLYSNPEAGYWMKRYAMLIPMLYCDALVDAMTKGLGQQRICVRYNIITSALDVGLLYLLLPIYGMDGYYFSFLITHAINFMLSFRRLLHITKFHPSYRDGIFGFLAAGLSLLATVHVSVFRVTAFLILLSAQLWIYNVIQPEDLKWMKNTIFGARFKKETPPVSA